VSTGNANNETRLKLATKNRTFRLISRLNAFKEENHYLRREGEAAKQTSHELSEENNSMSMQLKDLNNQIKLKKAK
jgi:FtsZ-binding cell division protein ZapB